MKILVINCGSSSLKYQLIEMQNEEVLAKGLVERIGLEGSVLNHEAHGNEYEVKEVIADHKDAIDQVLKALCDDEMGVITSMEDIAAVGHRVVHGGERYADAVLINEDVMECLEECAKLAPLHNPPNIIGIEACKELMPNVPMVGVYFIFFIRSRARFSRDKCIPSPIRRIEIHIDRVCWLF